MSYKLCNTCKGKKVLSSLGFIEYDCETCKGIGYIKPIEKIVAPTATFNPKLSAKLKGRMKYGRLKDDSLAKIDQSIVVNDDVG